MTVNNNLLSSYFFSLVFFKQSNKARTKSDISYNVNFEKKKPNVTVNFNRNNAYLGKNNNFYKIKYCKSVLKSNENRYNYKPKPKLKAKPKPEAKPKPTPKTMKYNNDNISTTKL